MDEERIQEATPETAAPAETGESGTAPPKRGRPKGSRTKPRQVVLVRPASCPGCQSTEREPYRLAFTRKQPGFHNGQRYDRIVYRDTKCKACGRPRREAHFEAD
jgi:hypothetical protein